MNNLDVDIACSQYWTGTGSILLHKYHVAIVLQGIHLFTIILSTFEYETWQEGSPYLVIVVDGDFDNVHGMQQEIVGINVGNLPPVDSGNSTIWLIGASIVIFSSIGALVFFMRGRGEDYYDDEDDYYDED